MRHVQIFSNWRILEAEVAEKLKAPPSPQFSLNRGSSQSYASSLVQFNALKKKKQPPKEMIFCPAQTTASCWNQSSHPRGFKTLQHLMGPIHWAMWVLCNATRVVGDKHYKCCPSDFDVMRVGCDTFLKHYNGSFQIQTALPLADVVGLESQCGEMWRPPPTHAANTLCYFCTSSSLVRRVGVVLVYARFKMQSLLAWTTYIIIWRSREHLVWSYRRSDSRCRFRICPHYEICLMVIRTNCIAVKQIDR